jgi:hypothetical protein
LVESPEHATDHATNQATGTATAAVMASAAPATTTGRIAGFVTVAGLRRCGDLGQ